jgi:hypothetical protein
MPSVAQFKRASNDCLMNPEGCGRKQSSPNAWHCPVTATLSDGSRSLCRDLNLEPLE